MTTHQLATTNQEPVPISDMEKMAANVATSGMFGVKTSAQAMALMLLCQAEGMHPMLALRRYHIVEGRPSMRADAMQGEFEARGGGVLWHLRTDELCGATLFADKASMKEKETIERAKRRFEAMKRGADDEVSAEAWPGEETIVRTAVDAWQKGISATWKDGKQILKHNWEQSPRQMLTARVITEGVRLIAPGLIAGIYSPDEIEDIPPDEPQTPREPRKDPLTEQREHVKAIAQDRASADWENIECHIGNAGGPVFGKTLGELFGEKASLKKAVSLMGWFEDTAIPGKEGKLGIGKSTNVKDIALVAALGEARKAINARISLEKDTPAPQTPPNTTNEPLGGKESQGEAVSKPDKTLMTPIIDDHKVTSTLFAPETPPVEAEVVNTPAPEKSAKPKKDRAKVTGLDWRNVTVPFACQIKGERLGNLPAKGGFTHVEVFTKIETELFKNEGIVGTASMADYNKFQAAYAIAKEELCIGKDDKLPKKMRDLSEDLAVSTEGLIEHAQKLGMVAVGPVTIKTWEKCSPDDLRNLIRNWPDFAQNVKDNFNIQPK